MLWGQHGSIESEKVLFRRICFFFSWCLELQNTQLFSPSSTARLSKKLGTHPARRIGSRSWERNRREWHWKQPLSLPPLSPSLPPPPWPPPTPSPLPCTVAPKMPRRLAHAGRNLWVGTLYFLKGKEHKTVLPIGSWLALDQNPYANLTAHALGQDKPVMCLYSNKLCFGFQHVDLMTVSCRHTPQLDSRD